MKSAVFERQRGHHTTALETLATAFTKFPKFAELYIIQGQIHQSTDKFEDQRCQWGGGFRGNKSKAAGRASNSWAWEDVDRLSTFSPAYLQPCISPLALLRSSERPARAGSSPRKPCFFARDVRFHYIIICSSTVVD